MKKLHLYALLTASLFLVPGIALSLTSAHSTEMALDQEDSLIERLDWLSGRWVIDQSQESGATQYIEETWSPAREDAMVGCLRWSRGGSVWLYELMSIEAEEEHGLVFRLRHFERNLKGWDSEKEGPLTYPLLDVGDNYAIFENPEVESPRRFVYRRSGDELTIRLENAEGEDEHPFVFSLAKSG